MRLHEYRLTSLEDPSDELLRELMEKVAEEARRSSRRAEAELQRRQRETAERIRSLRKQAAQ